MTTNTGTSSTILESLNDEWCSAAELRQKTRYAAGTLERFLPELVTRGLVVAKRVRPAGGRGRSALHYKRRPNPAALVLRIGLDQPDRQVQRTIRILGTATMRDLAIAVNAGMGWDAAHLEQFLVGDKYQSIVPIGAAYNGAESKREERMDHQTDLNERRKRLGKRPKTGAELRTVLPQVVAVQRVFRAVGDVAVYEYDFGDQWEHRIELVDVVSPEGNEPFLVDGSGECPEEDCNPIPGGTFAQEFLPVPSLSSARLAYYRARLNSGVERAANESVDPLVVLSALPGVKIQDGRKDGVTRVDDKALLRSLLAIVRFSFYDSVEIDAKIAPDSSTTVRFLFGQLGFESLRFGFGNGFPQLVKASLEYAISEWAMDTALPAEGLVVRVVYDRQNDDFERFAGVEEAGIDEWLQRVPAGERGDDLAWLYTEFFSRGVSDEVLRAALR